MALNLTLASLALSAAILLGRIAGFVRDIQIGSIYGLSTNADLAIVLLTTPDLMVGLLLAGGLSAALIPDLQRVEGSARARLAMRAMLAVGGAFAVMAGLVALFPSALLALLAPAYAGAPPDAFAPAMRIAALAIPLAALSGVTTAVLNSERRFFVAGAGTLIFNLTIVAMLALWPMSDTVLVLAVAVALAASLRLLSQLFAARETLKQAGHAAAAPRSEDLLKRFAGALAASTITLLVPVVIRAAVSTTGDGQLAAFSFATKLLDLPVGVVISAVAAVALPMLASAFRDNDPQQVSTHFREAMQRAVVAAVAIAVPATYFAHPLAAAVFGYGRMSEGDILQIAQLARIALLALPFVAIGMICSALLSARRETSRLLKLTGVAAGVVPIVLLAGAAFNEASVMVLTLPIYHAVLAAVLSRAVGEPPFGRGGWVDPDVMIKIAACVALTAVGALVADRLTEPSRYVVAAIALVVIGLSLIVASRRLIASRV